MYTTQSESIIEFWFSDYDEWLNIKDPIEDTIEAEHIGWVYCVDYMPEAIDQQNMYGGELIFPERGRCCIFVFNVTDADKVLSIAQSEYNEYCYEVENRPTGS